MNKKNFLEVVTSSQTEMVDITSGLQSKVEELDLESGLLVVYCPHTTGAVTINEGADPAVRRDIIKVLNSIVPWDFDYRHMEGNSPAHVKASLVGESVQIVVENRTIQLGQWQRVFFCEFDGPRRRKVWLKAMSS